MLNLLISLICPEKFVAVTCATKLAAGFSEKTNLLYNVLSLALKIGHSLKECCEILRGEALMTNNEILEKKCQSFLTLYNWQ